MARTSFVKIGLALIAIGAAVATTGLASGDAKDVVGNTATHTSYRFALAAADDRCIAQLHLSHRESAWEADFRVCPPETQKADLSVGVAARCAHPQEAFIYGTIGQHVDKVVLSQGSATRVLAQLAERNGAKPLTGYVAVWTAPRPPDRISVSANGTT